MPEIVHIVNAWLISLFLKKGSSNMTNNHVKLCLYNEWQEYSQMKKGTLRRGKANGYGCKQKKRKDAIFDRGWKMGSYLWRFEKEIKLGIFHKEWDVSYYLNRFCQVSVQLFNYFICTWKAQVITTIDVKERPKQ